MNTIKIIFSAFLFGIYSTNTFAAGESANDSATISAQVVADIAIVADDLDLGQVYTGEVLSSSVNFSVSGEANEGFDVSNDSSSGVFTLYLSGYNSGTASANQKIELTLSSPPTSGVLSGGGAGSLAFPFNGTVGSSAEAGAYSGNLGVTITYNAL